VLVLAVSGAGILGYQLGAWKPTMPAASPAVRQLVVENPYAAGGTWYTGNLHVASVRGIGRDLPSALGRWYGEHDYAFLGISDQNTYTWPSEFATRGFTGLAVVDASYGFADLLAVNMDYWLPASTLQQAVDWIGGDAGLPVLAAPLSPAKPQQAASLLSLKRLFGLEVYDARLAAAGPGQGDATGMWDQLLSAGQRVFAFAGDDALGLDDPALGRAWISVLAPAPDATSLLSSLRQGAFIASSGAGFVSFSVDRNTIAVQANTGSTLRFIGRGGRLLQVSSGPTGSYQVRGNEGYVRVEAIRDDGARAWSQPFFLSWR
jgi:hypothetical protein